MVVLHLRTVPSSAARCFASADFASLCVLEASAASRPPMKAELPCLLGLLRPASATGGGLRAPPPVSAKILRIFERGNCKEAIFALENGIFRRGVLRAPAPLNSAWSSHTFAPPCANACAVFRPCGLRFAPCPRGSSRFAASDARKLACGTPCFIGLTSACFAHCARPPCAPRPSTPSGLRRAYFALLRAQRARFVRPLWERGAFWIVARRSRDGGIDTPQSAIADSSPWERGAFWAQPR